MTNKFNNFEQQQKKFKSRIYLIIELEEKPFRNDRSPAQVQSWTLKPLKLLRNQKLDSYFLNIYKEIQRKYLFLSRNLFPKRV
jgi:hypothetical protein